MQAKARPGASYRNEIVPAFILHILQQCNNLSK